MLSLMTLAVTAVTLASSVLAQTSLYIPGFDPQPVTADVLGVGADGQTTWLIAPGVSSGGLDENGFFGPATLIAGPNSAEVIYHDPGMGVDADDKCAINGAEADCTALLVLNGATSTMVISETVAPFEVQVGGSAPPTGAPSAPTDPASAGSSPTTLPAQTSTPAPQPSASGAHQSSISSPSAGGSSRSGSQSTGAPAPTNTTNAASPFSVPAFAAWSGAAAFAIFAAI